MLHLPAVITEDIMRNLQQQKYQMWMLVQHQTTHNHLCQTHNGTLIRNIVQSLVNQQNKMYSNVPQIQTLNV